MLCLTCRRGADPRGRRFGRHRLAGMTETHDIVKLPLADAEEGGSITYRVAGEAFGTQPWIVESDARWQVVGAHSAPLGRRCVFDLKQRPQTPSTLALQRLDPKLQPLHFESGRAWR